MADVLGQVVADTTTRTHCSGAGGDGRYGRLVVIASAVMIFKPVWLVRLGSERGTRSDQNALTILERRPAEDAISFDDYRG